MAADPSDSFGQLIQFPLVQQTCFVCPHHGERTDEDGLSSWCEAYDQPIDSEAYEAEDCPLFSVDPEKVER